MFNFSEDNRTGWAAWPLTLLDKSFVVYKLADKYLPKMAMYVWLVVVLSLLQNVAIDGKWMY